MPNLKLLAPRILVAIVLAAPSLAHDVATSWNSTKNTVDDTIYGDNKVSFYCGCDYSSLGNASGSGTVDMGECGMEALPLYAGDADEIQYEHIVPSSLMPARQMACYLKPERFAACVTSSGNVKDGRDCCEDIDGATAQLMMFDLHNLAPSIGQVNQYRGNDRYGEIDDEDDHRETWVGCAAEHVREAHVLEHRFEPADCTKGDVARIWMYMAQQHGLAIPDDEWAMFQRWSDDDPVSPWEPERDRRIGDEQGNRNPFVEGVTPEASGACDWEPQ